MSCKSGLLLAAALFLMPCVYAQPANSFDCGPKITGQPLVTIPEIQSSNGMLRGTLYTVSEQQKMTTPQNGIGSDPYCFPQWVRAYRRSAPSSWDPPSSQISDPMPGPTLRARLGDVVGLTFLNVIDPSKFPGVDDGKCDETSIYPGPNATMTSPDTYPDCFASSVYTNMHYHGTHTNPNTTGDNVFIEVAPSPRKTDNNAPAITATTVQPSFSEFFDVCKEQLMASDGPKIWPRVWSDLPKTLQTTLMDAVKASKPAWWTANQKLIAQGHWPQYYIGAVPYCFRLPQYKSTAGASIASASVHTPHTHGAGQAEVDEAAAPSRPMIMGQAPGTHWYHAHKHGSTTINVMNGMTGVFIIEGPYDDDINKYYGENWTRKQPVLVVQQLGSVPGLVTNQGGGPGPDFSTNGQLRPTISMPGSSVQMWRIANTAGRAGIYFQAPSAGGLQWMQLAQDGVQFNNVNYQASHNIAFLLASGNRADLLVKAPPFDAAPGAKNTYDVLVFNTVDPSDHAPQKPNVDPITLVTVKVTANGPNMDFMPEAPRFPDYLGDVTDAEITGTKVLKFASAAVAPVPNAKFPSQQTIDGKKFDGEVGAVVLLNRAEEWKIINETYPPANSNQISHPFHIHINPFQVSEYFDPNAILSTTPGTGTIDVAARASGSNSAVVTGNGFKNAIRPGDWLWITSKGTDPKLGPSMVLSVDTDTQLTINNSQSKPITGASYVIATPLYTIDKANAKPGQCVLDLKDPKPCSSVVPAKDRIWWDVFPMPSGGTFLTAAGKIEKVPGYFKMRSRFVDYSGYFVLHCHILAHEDRGMMTVVEVAPLQTPYSHH